MRSEAVQRETRFPSFTPSLLRSFPSFPYIVSSSTLLHSQVNTACQIKDSPGTEMRIPHSSGASAHPALIRSMRASEHPLFNLSHHFLLLLLCYSDFPPHGEAPTTPSKRASGSSRVRHCLNEVLGESLLPYFHVF